MESALPLALTNQEKKVLGFILLMVGLGLVMLAVQRVGPSKPSQGNPGMPATVSKTS